jgi:hypothetical protein
MTSTTGDSRLALATGLFGDATALIADRDAWYRGVATTCALAQPALDVATVDDAYARIVQRSRLDDLFSPTVWPDPADGWLEEASDHEIRPGLWLTNMAGAGGDREQFRARARRIFPEAEFGPLALRDIDADAIGHVDAAVALLESSFADVWGQCAATISLIALHRSEVVSMQSSYTPETVYIGDALLRGPVWRTADGLLHEALHERTLLARQLWRVLRAGYDEESAPAVHLPWSGGDVPDRYFTPWRLISAAHVYTHLATFRSVIGQRDEVTLPAFRGRFMLDALERPDFEADLGVEGIELRDTLSRALREVE